MREKHEFSNILAAPSASEIDELAERSQNLEYRITSLNNSYETLKKREVELTEWRWVLREAGGFFDRVWITLLPHAGVTYTDRLSRPMGVLMRSANQQTTMKLHYCKTSNNNIEGKMVMPQANNPSPS